MCQADASLTSSNGNYMPKNDASKSNEDANPTNNINTKHRREKRDKEGQYVVVPTPRSSSTTTTTTMQPKKKKKQSKALQRHSKDSPSGGIESLIPSLIGVGVLVVTVMAQRGFRGRASVAGIDLGTTNSVICVQKPSKSVGEIDCIKDPDTGSPIIPSVVAFLEPHERKVGPSSKTKSNLLPHPSHVLVGQKAKQRIDSHPHHTLYNAKRVLGRPLSDPAVSLLRQEVEFHVPHYNNNNAMEETTTTTTTTGQEEIAFQVDDMLIPPQQVGSYIVNHLMQITKAFLGHDNVKSAVLAVPAKFNTLQRQRTMEAFKNAGVTIARVLEEPAAAALAYGLHKKEGVEKILVYDFGGGTLDVSILHVSEGYVEVIGSDGDDRLGGADFDAAVANLLAEQHQNVLTNLASYCQEEGVDAEQLAASCSSITEELPLCSVSSFHTIGEQLKIALSSSQEEGATKQSQCLGLPHATAADKGRRSMQSICDELSEQPLVLSLEDYNQAVKPLFDRSISPVTRLLKDLTLRPDEIDEIVMVGGTTRMPQIRELVRGAFSTAQLNTHIDPDITVAYGAASVID